jgi:hypothetical protein
MPLFTLPLQANSRTPIAHTPLSRSRKRKRAASPSEASDTSDVDTDHESKGLSRGSSPARGRSSLSVAITNPLSLAPDEIIQYKAAGLPLDEPLPNIKDFPHRRLELSTEIEVVSRAEDDEDEDTFSSIQRRKTEKLEDAKKDRREGLRLQHLGTLTAVLHRCLLEGDIPRASRAWAMLLRVQVGGKAVELRSSGYWGIGAELLIRQGAENEGGAQDNDESAIARGITEASTRRWGTAEGLARAKDYYERLILQYPYRRQFHDTVNSLDFWPAMLGCEIYGMQSEQRESLLKIDEDEENDDEEDNVSNDGTEDGESQYASQQRFEAKKRLRHDEKWWWEREQVRMKTLAAAQAIAARMDELMTSPPFSDSRDMLRLRGMLSLYIGDLSLPAAFPGDEDDDEYIHTQSRDRMAKHQRLSEREAGLQRQRGERAMAARMFQKVRNLGGQAPDVGGIADEESP